MGDDGDATLMKEYVKRKTKECLEKLNDGVRDEADGSGFCEWFFDGFLCWERTEAGSVAMQMCPDDDFIFSSVKVSFLKHRDLFRN